jgi:hypothetical protein
MRAVVARLAPALLLVAGSASLAHPQVLRGTLLDGRQERITGANVTLRDSAGGAVGAAIADQRGVFHIPAPRAGTYVADVRRIGFDPWTSPPIRLDRGESVEIEVRMNDRPPVLATMTVRGRAHREWGRDGWSKRKAAGRGTFLTGDEVMEKRTVTIAEALRDVPGLMLSYRPFPALASTEGNRCLNLLVNRQPIPLIPGQPVEATLHNLIGPEQVAGVEIYAEYRQVPVEFRNMAVQSMRPELAAQLPPATIVDEPGRARMCGIINVWTWRAW